MNSPGTERLILQFLTNKGADIEEVCEGA